MLTQNETTWVSRWYLLVTALTGLIVLSSCVSLTLDPTGSTAMPDSEAYKEIKTQEPEVSDYWYQFRSVNGTT